ELGPGRERHHVVLHGDYVEDDGLAVHVHRAFQLAGVVAAHLEQGGGELSVHLELQLVVARGLPGVARRMRPLAMSRMVPLWVGWIVRGLSQNRTRGRQERKQNE